MSTSKQMYAETLSAVSTLTTFPLVLNFFLWSPSSPTSEKNCLFPICVSAKKTSLLGRPASLHTLLSSEQADEQNACAINSEQRTNGIELGRKDLEYN